MAVIQASDLGDHFYSPHILGVEATTLPENENVT